MVEQDEWPERAWILAVLGSAAGAIIGLIVGQPERVPVFQLALATFAFTAFVVLALTLERRRWTWSVGASLAVGALLALIGWNTARYRGYGWEFGWPFASAVVASLLIVPLFQAVRDLGELRLPPERVHAHVWADFVIGAVGVAFVGVALLLIVLIDQLLRLVGIAWIERLWDTDWFGWAVAGAAFGAVAARLRDRSGLLGTLLTVKFTVLAVLAPVLAIGIALFLGALPFGGLKKFWDATGSSTVILLACAVLAVWLVNAVASNNPSGSQGEGRGGQVLRGAALVLALSVLPLALVGAAGLWIRVAALGWTPTRLWGVAAILVAAAWGGVYLWTIVRARGLDDRAIFAGNVRMAVGVAALALLLAVPLVDFGAISARDQVSRLTSGRVTAERFDWAALAFEFGPAGKPALAELSRSSNPAIVRAATAAAKAGDRSDLATADQRVRESAARRAVANRAIRVHPAAVPVPLALRRAIFGVEDETVDAEPRFDRYLQAEGCDADDRAPCHLFWHPGDPTAVAVQDVCANPPAAERARWNSECEIAVTPLRLIGQRWTRSTRSAASIRRGPPEGPTRILSEREAIERGDVTVRTVTRRQVFVGDQPASDLFE